MKFKPISDQTVVITGASSGIGLCTARMFARAGARVVLSARSGDALQQIVEELVTGGGTAIAVPADVAKEDEVMQVARRATQEFGGIDTWVNNAGVSIYGRIEEVPLEDAKRLFATNFWGVVNGSRIALDHLRSGGGSIINIGSCLSDRAIPLQGLYSASKHAVKGFTDALRMEVEEAGLPVSVTLIKPGAIDTPYVRHAKNFLPEEPTNPPPVYAPETVARAILHAATHQVRDIVVGAGGKMLSLMDQFPRFSDKLMEKTMFRQQKSGLPPRPRDQHALDKPSNDPQEYGGYSGLVQNHSLYTAAALRPVLTTTVLLAAGAALAAVLVANSDPQTARQVKKTAGRFSRRAMNVWR